jgi:isopentenyldiphosphate isomerase
MPAPILKRNPFDGKVDIPRLPCHNVNMARFTDPPPFPPHWLEALQALDVRWQGGDAATQSDIDEALALWRQRLHRPPEPDEEWFDIVDATGEPLGLMAPRWFAHLTGLRHRVVHVLCTTPQGLLVLQMRSHRRPDWAQHFSTTAAGHVKAGETWQQAALAEIEEEVGLTRTHLSQWLATDALVPVGAPYLGRKRQERHPTFLNGLPMLDWQVNQIFTGEITAWGLTAIHFDDGEVDGVYLTPPKEVARLVQQRDPSLAPNLFEVFPRWQQFHAGVFQSRGKLSNDALAE